MASKKTRTGCIVFSLGGFAILLLAAAALWWFSRPEYPAASPSESPVQVFLLSPSSGEEFEAGDHVPLSVQVIAPAPLQNVQFIVDGQPAASTAGLTGFASWSWLAWPAGIHTLSAQATDSDGRVGFSPTVIVTVLAGDGFIEVSAEDGASLGAIGGSFGVGGDDIADANPNIDPSLPLQGGQPINIPVDLGGGSGPPAGNGEPSPSPNLNIPLLINWQFKPIEPVDQSYCYTSHGDGQWTKIPKNPFSFLPMGSSSYPQIIPSPPGAPSGGGNNVLIKMQCWGWLAGELKFLGEAETGMDYMQPTDQVIINAAAFQMIGVMSISPPPPPNLYDLIIPPPFALREPTDTADCNSHFGPASDGYVCDTLLNAPLQQYRILEWEWEPKTNWPGYETWYNGIDGYRFYEIDKLNNTRILMKEIAGYTQKVAAVLLPWGARCYQVEAFAHGPNGDLVSTSSEYCPGDTIPSQMMVISPVNWLTAGGKWVEDGDCDTYGGADAYQLLNKNTGFGSQPEMLVGSYIVDDDNQDCFRQGSYGGAVQFSNFLLPDGAVFQKALLKYSVQKTEYGASGVISNYHPDCVAGVGYALQDWSNLVDPNHFHSKNVLNAPSYFSPIVSSNSLSGGSGVDVTPAAMIWMANAAQNFGLILSPAAAPHPVVDGTGVCESQVGNLQLEIYYYIAP